MTPGARGDRSWWDDGQHQQHAPDNNPMLAFILAALVAVLALMLWSRS